jgi:phosphorylase kinase alpha/beta subunit
VKGDATLCCAAGDFSAGKVGDLKCGGTAGICSHFYDSAPSGTYGTMSYLVRACCVALDAVPKEGDIECHSS